MYYYYYYYYSENFFLLKQEQAIFLRRARMFERAEVRGVWTKGKVY